VLRQGVINDVKRHACYISSKNEFLASLAPEGPKRAKS